MSHAMPDAAKSMEGSDDDSLDDYLTLDAMEKIVQEERNKAHELDMQLRVEHAKRSFKQEYKHLRTRPKQNQEELRAIKRSKN